MKNITFDENFGCNVLEFDNIVKASEALAKQLHEEAVANHEAIDSDWTDRGYAYCLTNEARAMLEENGKGNPPVLEGHCLIIMKSQTCLQE